MQIQTKKNLAVVTAIAAAVSQPSTHYVQFSQGVLFRDAPLSIVWPQIAWMGGLGGFYVLIALGRFRSMLASANG